MATSAPWGAWCSKPDSIAQVTSTGTGMQCRNRCWWHFCIRSAVTYMLMHAMHHGAMMGGVFNTNYQPAVCTAVQSERAHGRNNGPVRKGEVKGGTKGGTKGETGLGT